MSYFFTISSRFCYCSPCGGCHGRSPPRGTPETAIRSVVPQMVGQFNYLSKHRDVSAIREALNLNAAAKRQRQMQRGKKKAFVGKSAATIQLMLTQWQLKTVMTKTVYVFWIFHFILAIFLIFNPHCLILQSIRAIKYNCIKPQNNNETNKQLDKKLHLTTVELQLVVKVIQFLLDVSWTRTVLAHTEGQQHVDLRRKHNVQLILPLLYFQKRFDHLITLQGSQGQKKQTT